MYPWVPYPIIYLAIEPEYLPGCGQHTVAWYPGTPQYTQYAQCTLQTTRFAMVEDAV